MASARARKARAAANAGGHVEWQDFYALKKERLKRCHPELTAREIVRRASEAYQIALLASPLLHSTQLRLVNHASRQDQAHLVLLAHCVEAEKERLLRENPKMKNKAILKKASQAYRKHKAEWEAQQAANEG
ncbi:hypothetical protein Rhopal_002532-T1 [Rhodotorula paludigena]|uniref:Uncharacterized protein n=1 Tax=Rhodotorula paludigena TaxID=86838 RepID=A0AAV5GIA8_9BASI|nr:hypothetical protein Rhopal_002532-T1 [Rhodotorula paludigena]